MDLFSKQLPQKVEICCGACGHKQREYAEAKNTFCRNCGTRIDLEDSEKRRRDPSKKRVDSRRVDCLHCGVELKVPVSAYSWQCHFCSSYLDFSPHPIMGEQSGSIQTYSDIVMKPGGKITGAVAEGQNVTLAGYCTAKVTAREKLVITGKTALENEASCKELIVENHGSVKSNYSFECDSAMIAGKVEARSIVCRGRLEILESGTVDVRELKFRSLFIATGAQVSGHGVSLEEEKNSEESDEVREGEKG